MAFFNYLNGFAGQSGFLDILIIFLAVYLWYLLVLTFGLVLLFDQTKNWLQKCYWLITTLLAGGAARLGVAEIIRYFYHHPRPSGTALILETSSSFPSGHTIFVLAFATVVYFYNKKIGFWFGIAGLLIGLARVAAGGHWLSDVWGGIILGIFTGMVVNYFASHLKLRLKFPG